MKKKRVENFPWIPMGDGRRVKFDGTRFRDEVNEMMKKRKYSASDVFRGIIASLYPNYPKDAIENNLSTVRKWYDLKNGPRDLLKIHKPLAEFFNCEEDAFLIYEEIEEESKMNMTATQTMPVFPNGYAYPKGDNQMIKAMERMKEKEIAHELYGKLMDLIAAYVQVDQNIWYEHSGYAMSLGELEELLKTYPQAYPVRVAIRKSAIFLPKEVRYRALDLVDEMYTYVWCNGSYGCEWDELSFKTTLGDGFIDNKMDHFKAYLKEHEMTEESSDMDAQDDQWYWFLEEQHEEWYNRLDDIFSDYLCD